jgi:exodeoxyribonuclease VII large subunit
VVDYLEFDDVGRMRARLEELKMRLDAEGAFDAARRRPLPFLPEEVALITSPTGAVIHDLQQTIWDRFPNMRIVVYPAQVQGTASPGSIAAALRRCNQDGTASVVVIARGGGSFEELYAFNTEPVARAVLASRIPVVTALGHTSDRTVADMVADAECRTPTEAGARVVPRKAALQQQLREAERRLLLGSRGLVGRHAQGLEARSERLRPILPRLLRQRAERIERCRRELARLSPLQQVVRRQEALRDLGARLSRAELVIVANRRQSLDGRRTEPRLRKSLMDRFKAAEDGLAHRAERLAALAPDAVLSRGYSITHDAATGRVLRSAAETGPGKAVRVRLATGSLAARVEEVTG